MALEEGLRTSVIRQKIQANQRFHLAFVDDALAAVAAVRDDSHVFQLFVGTRYQGRASPGNYGIAFAVTACVGPVPGLSP